MTLVSLPAPSAAEIARELPDAEYARLSAVPIDLLAERFQAQADAARAFLAREGRPLWRAVSLDLVADARDEVTAVDGRGARTVLASRRLARSLRKAGAHALVVALVGAGGELEREAASRWRDRPDEAWFLDRLGAATVEHLLRDLRARHPSWTSPLAPGYAGWPIEDQALLLRLVDPDATSGVRLTDGGMLAPKNSMLVAFGVTCAEARPADDVPCATCSLSPCAFRSEPRQRSLA